MFIIFFINVLIQRYTLKEYETKSPDYVKNVNSWFVAMDPDKSQGRVSYPICR